jgi:hypothetical protein
MKGRSVGPWLAFIIGGAAGLGILLLTQALSESRIAVGPFALYGNGALAAPALGMPVALYAGWISIGARAEALPLGRLAAYAGGLAIGGGPLGILFGAPIILLAAAVVALFAPGRVAPTPTRLWAVFFAGAVVSSLPAIGLFGMGILPGAATRLGRGRRPRERIAIGAAVAVAVIAVVFGSPLLIYPLFGLPPPGPR